MVSVPSGISVYSPKIANQSLVRKFVSLNGSGYVAITIYDGANAVDPDANTLKLQVWFDDTSNPDATDSDPRGTRVINITDSTQITRADTGMYHYAIGPTYTGNRGVLTAQWSYSVGGTPFTYDDYLQILDQMPLYEKLSDDEKGLVEQVSWMIGDLFDSTEGGPHLIEEFQTHFDYERIAFLATLATTRFNYIGFPVTTYSFGEGGGQGGFTGLLVIGTYIEVVRHLVRSYAEIPIWQNMNVTYEDRQQYMARWKQILDSELAEYQTMVKMAKRSLLQLGRGALLVAGGFYGPGGGRSLFLFSPYSAMTRSFRFYPAAPAISFPATRIP